MGTCADFDPDADWEYIVIKEEVRVVLYDSATESYLTSAPYDRVDAFTYDRTASEKPNGDTETLVEEVGFVLRASCLPNVTICDKTAIIRDDGSTWIITGDIQLLTKKTRWRLTAYKSTTGEAGT